MLLTVQEAKGTRMSQDVQARNAQESRWAPGCWQDSHQGRTLSSSRRVHHSAKFCVQIQSIRLETVHTTGKVTTGEGTWIRFSGPWRVCAWAAGSRRKKLGSWPDRIWCGVVGSYENFLFYPRLIFPLEELLPTCHCPLLVGTAVINQVGHLLSGRQDWFLARH